MTRPRCAFVEPGLPFKRMAWKTLKPGNYQGYYESYRSEIAAYELDKLLGLGMIPPTVERHIKAEVGAAMLWVENVKSWDVKNPVTRTRQEGLGPPAACGSRCSTSSPATSTATRGTCSTTPSTTSS